MEPEHLRIPARDGFELAASVSRAAVAELAIAPEMPVVAAFKATAVRVTEGEGAGAIA